jgi:hypothetical protein
VNGGIRDERWGFLRCDVRHTDYQDENGEALCAHQGLLETSSSST